jgi:hypothetical protein
MERLEQEELRAEALKTTLVFRTEDPFWTDLTTVRYNVFDTAMIGQRIRINFVLNPDFDKVGPQWADTLEGGKVYLEGTQDSNIVTDFDPDIKNIPGSTVPITEDPENIWDGPQGYKIIQILLPAPGPMSEANGWTVEGLNFEWDTILSERSNNTDEYLVSLSTYAPDGVASLYQRISGLETGIQYSGGIAVIPVVGRVRLMFDFFNDNSVRIGTASTPWYDAQDSQVIEDLSKGFPLQLEHTFLVPMDNYVTFMRLQIAPSEGSVIPEAHVLVDKAILEKGNQIGYWFDGNSKDIPSGMKAGWLDPTNAPMSRSYAEPTKKESYVILESIERNWFPIPPLDFSSESRPQEMTLFNNGHGDAWPTWVIGGPCLEVRMSSLDLSQYLEIDFNRPELPSSIRAPDGLPKGSILSIDTWSKKMAIVDSTGQVYSAFYYRTPESRFWPFIPGENKFTLQITSGSKDTTCMFFYKRRWLNA